MARLRSKINRLALIIIIICFVGLNSSVVKGAFELTPEENTYIEKVGVIKAASIEGGAPLHYTNSKGEITGIGVQVLEEISRITGLAFEYSLYSCIEDGLNSDADVYFGLTPEYSHQGITLSIPYLKSETLLFYNDAYDPHKLKDKIYASIKGGALPAGVKEENVIFFDSREATLDAVESGKAAYGYGNAYSLAFYTLQNGYKNIITIPRGQGDRNYSIGLAQLDPILLGIINKAISEIDDATLTNMILAMNRRRRTKINLLHGNGCLWATDIRLDLPCGGNSIIHGDHPSESQ